jgi:hypothetical protein
MKSKTPNSSYYRNKADEIFMAQFRGKPCEVCGAVSGTVGHHNVNKARSKALRYDKRNITVLCQKHHTMGNDICPHSSNPMAVDRYFGWLKETHHANYKWIKENERIVRKYTYKRAWENLREGKEAWE